MAEESIFSKVKPLKPAATFNFQQASSQSLPSKEMEKIASDISQLKNEINDLKKVISSAQGVIGGVDEKVWEKFKNEIVAGIKNAIGVVDTSSVVELNKKLEEIIKILSEKSSVNKDDIKEIKSMIFSMGENLKNIPANIEALPQEERKILLGIGTKIDGFLENKFSVFIEKLKKEVFDKNSQIEEIENRINRLLNERIDLIIENLKEIMLNSNNKVFEKMAEFIDYQKTRDEKFKIECKNMVDEMNNIVNKMTELTNEISKTDIDPSYIQKLFNISYRMVQIHSSLRTLLNL
jgi:hypothetical protein